MPFKKEFQDADLFEKVEQFGSMYWKMYGMMTDEQKAMSGGVLLNELKVRVKAAVNETNRIKLVILSGHDTTLAAILTVFGVYDYVQTPYATLLMLEVYESEGEYQIRFHRHNKDKELVSYQLPGCDKEGCDLQQFYGLQSGFELTPEQFKTMCQTGTPDFIPSISKNALLLLLAITILLCLSSTAMLTWYTYRLKSKAEWSGLSEQNAGLLSGY